MTRGEAKRLRALIEQLAVTLNDETALTGIQLFPMWKSGKEYAVNDRVQYSSKLYKCIQAHTSQDDWTPDATPALWKVVSLETYPEWVQPTGAHDAYELGALVSHNGKHWESMIQANTYEPGIYGWDEI